MLVILFLYLLKYIIWGFVIGAIVAIIVFICKTISNKPPKTLSEIQSQEFSVDNVSEWYCPKCDYKNKSGHICKSCGYEAKVVAKTTHIKEYSAEALGVMAKPIKENTAPKCEPKVVNKPAYAKEYSTETLGVTAKPVKNNNALTAEPHIKQEFLPYSIDGMPYSYSYEDVHICIIKERMPDMNKIKECAYENATVTVKLEPENPYDNEAVALYTANDIHMGYLYRNRLKDMAYDYLNKGLPIRARITKIEDEDIYINIAFYAPKKEIKYTNEISFTLISRSEEMQYNLSYAEVSDELDYYFDDIKEKFIFTLDYSDIGYAPKKYEELLDKIVHYNCRIIKVNELESGNVSVKISIQYAD